MCLALPGKVEKILYGENDLNPKNIANAGDNEISLMKTADINFEGVVSRVNVAFLENIKVGDYVIVHAGVAIQILDEKEAIETIKNFQDLNNINLK